MSFLKLLIGFVAFTIAVGTFIGIVKALQFAQRKNVAKRLAAAHRVVEWGSFNNSPDCGVVWINKSRQYFYGLRLWWIPIPESRFEDKDIDCIAEWVSKGQLIQPQNLARLELEKLGCKIFEYEGLWG